MILCCRTQPLGAEGVAATREGGGGEERGGEEDGRVKEGEVEKGEWERETNRFIKEEERE